MKVKSPTALEVIEQQRRIIRKRRQENGGRTVCVQRETPVRHGIKIGGAR